ncbi:OTU domain-containing protein [Legionella jordanis]|uniref:OTU domain-containing protein n=1 Tax=Legionella jordanis TaxID=456 RepID=UPI0007D090E7|nr:OTU domain-containing protein [Legionella jordanis]VEH13882.1 Uncharacterised protein [Legionella jordanis]
MKIGDTIPTATTGFFRVPREFPSSPKKEAEAAFVDVGGNGDCGPRAIAAAFISKALAENKNSPELQALLQRHFMYYPQHKATIRLATPMDSLRFIIRHFSMGELVDKLADTIRQVAVAEMNAHPERYRGAFIDDEGMPVSPAAMRLSTTWIDETFIAAAAEAIKNPITVQVVAKERELPLSLPYQATGSQAKPLVIQLQNKHYIPRVQEPARFQHIRASYPAERRHVEENDPSMDEILQRIAEDERRILTEFESTKRRLMAAVDAGEIDKKQLLDIYISGLTQSDYFRGYVGVEHGTEDFFRSLKQKAHQGEIIRMPTGNQEKEVTTQLVHAIARAISIGQLQPAVVFDKIEQVQNRAQHLSPGF